MKKLAEDAQFDDYDLVQVIEAFSLAMMGSEILYHKCQELALKFKYAISMENLVGLLFYIQLA